MKIPFWKWSLTAGFLKRPLSAVAIMTSLFSAMDHAQAQSRTDYTGPAGGDWTNASYWSNGLPNGDGVLSSQRWAVIRQAAGQGPVISGGAEVSAYLLQVGLNDGSPGGLDDGSGALTLTGGSLLTTDASSAIATGAGGSNQGVVSIDGSTWRALSDITVGDTGDGSLILSNGGRVESTFILAGNNALSHGVISLSGNSTLALSQGLVIGNFATANLTISGGSSVSNEEAFIDRYSAGGSTVMVDGGSWTNRSYLDMGALSSLTIRNGGSVSVGDGAGGDGTGRLSIHGGTITIGGYAGATLQAPGALSAGEVRADTLSTIVFQHNSGSYVFSPDLSGVIALNVQSGTTILTGDFSSTYTGNTGGSAAYIGNGTLQIGNGGTEGYADASVYIGNGALVFNRSDDIVTPMGIGGTSSGIIRQNGTGKVTLTGFVGGTGGLNLVEVNGGDLVLAADMLFSPTKQGSGTLVINGSTGTFESTGRYFSPTVLAGTLQFGDGAASTAVYPEGTIDLAGGNLAFNRLEDVNIGFNISSTGSSGGQVRKRGSNTLTLSGAAVNYSIPTVVEGGELVRDAGSESVTWYSSVSGAGAFGKSGSGTLYLSSVLSQAGGTRIHEGTLYMSTGSSISGAITIDEGAWLRPSGVLTGDISGDGGLTVDGSATLFGSLSYTGPTNITGSLTINPGNFASTLSGLVTNNGTLAVGTGSHAVEFLGGIENNGVLNISGGPAVIGAFGTISGTGSINIASGGTLQFVGGGTRTINAPISGAGGLIVSNNQWLTLAGGAAFTGFTTIGAATLEIVGSLSSSNVTMTASGYSQLAFSGSGSFSGNATGTGTLTRNAGGSTTLYGNVSNNDPNGYTLYIDEGGEFVIAGSLSGTGDIYNGGSLVFDNSTPLVYGGVITGSHGSIVVRGGSQVGLLGSLGYSSLRLEGEAGALGTLTLGNFGALGDPSSQLIFDGGRLVLPASVGSIRSSITLEDGGGTIETQASDPDFVWVQTGITGTGGLRKTGSGTLVLVVANTYTGGTTLQGGTLALGDSGNILSDTGSLAITSGVFKLGNADETIGSLSGTGGVIDLFMGSGRTLTVNQSLDGTFSGTLQGFEGRLVKDGAGVLTLAGTNTYTGGTTIKAGTLSFATDANLGALSGALTIDGGTLRNTAPLITSRQIIIGENGATFENGGGYLTITTPLSGPGGITRTGGGILTLHGDQTYEGPTVISNGHFKVENGTLASPSVSLAAGSIFYAINIGAYAGEITGSGALWSEGANVLSGSNTFSGGTVLAGGTLRLENDHALGTGTLTTRGSVVDYADGVNIANPLVLDSDHTELQVLAGTAEQSGDISEENGPSPLAKTGSGTLILSGENTYTGATTVSAGKLVIGSDYGVPSTSAVTVASGATLAVRGDEVWTAWAEIGSLAGAGTVEIGDYARLTVGADDSDTIFSGSIVSTGTYGDFGKTGSGKLTLTGASTIHGYLEICSCAPANTLEIDGGSFTTTDSTLVWGGTLSLVNGGRLETDEMLTFGTVKIADAGSTVKAGTVYVGDIDTAGTLEIGEGGTLDAGSVYVMGLGSLTVDGAIENDSLTTVAGGGVLSGSGAVGDLLVSQGGILSPGNSPGTLSAQDTAWEGGGTYVFEINNATGTTGTNWDLLNVSGTLTLDSISSENPFTIAVTSLGADNAPGDAANFDPLHSYTWILVSASGGISGFSADKFSIATSGFFNAPNFDRFTIGSTGTNLTLTYSAVPEPQTVGIAIGVGLLALAASRRRRR